MKTVKKIASQILVFLTFLVLSSMLWGWLFTVVTDTAPENKITIYIDCQTVADTALAARLEEDLPEGVRMVKVHPFSYAFFDSDAMEAADLFIVPKSKADVYRDSFAVCSISNENTLTLSNGVTGDKIYDAASGTGGAAKYITYINEAGETEDFYLFYGAASLHVASNENAVDNAAAEVARLLFTIE